MEEKPRMKKAAKIAYALVAGICLALFGRMVFEGIIWTGFGAVRALHDVFHKDVTSEEADDGVSKAVAQKFSEEDVWYRGKAVWEDGTIQYKYYLVSNREGVLEELMEAANGAILQENVQDRIEVVCYQHYEGGSTTRSTPVAHFYNYSLERKRFYQTLGRCSVCEGFDGIYEMPETYGSLPGVVDLEISPQLDLMAKSRGMDWYACYPQLEYFEAAPVIGDDGWPVVAETEDGDVPANGDRAANGDVPANGDGAANGGRTANGDGAAKGGRTAELSDATAEILLIYGERTTSGGKDFYQCHWFANELGNRCYAGMYQENAFSERLQFGNLMDLYAHLEEDKGDMDVEKYVYPYMSELEVFDCAHYLEVTEVSAPVEEFPIFAPDGTVVEESGEEQAESAVQSVQFLCGVRKGENGRVEFVPLIEYGKTEKRSTDEYAQRILRMLKYIVE